MKAKNIMIHDIHPKSPTTALTRNFTEEMLKRSFPLSLVSALVGMNAGFVKKALGSKRDAVSLESVLHLLDMDAYAETFIPRSRIPQYLLNWQAPNAEPQLTLPKGNDFVQGSASTLIPRLPRNTIQCVVTSTPYWGLRLYNDSFLVHWADGEVCPFGNEQTPEAFIRHTVELLFLLKPVITASGSVWWNLMDTYNTRTQIRENAAETLRAMRGEEDRGWHDYDCRRYSAGHAFLKDGEQCLIPSRVAERATRLGYFVKSIITWKKNGSMPETVETRVTRELEYIIHLGVDRSPLFNKVAYREIPESLGGRHTTYESEKLTDVWCFRTSGGRDGHGAQFPMELPGRCIALSTNKGDVVLDPFIGAGTTAFAAQQLGRRCLGFDVSNGYLEVARNKALGKKKVTTQATAELPLLEILR
jgi:DNA modification methylase